MAKEHGRAETINFEETDVDQKLMEMTKGRGPDRCIDAVGAEAHAAGTVFEAIDDAKEAMHMPSNHPYVLAEAIKCCRKGGTLSIPGVYTATVDNFPMSAAMNKGLTLKMGQTHVQHYLKDLLAKVVDNEIDPSFVVTHRGSLDDAPALYKTFAEKSDQCIKVVLTP